MRTIINREREIVSYMRFIVRAPSGLYLTQTKYIIRLRNQKIFLDCFRVLSGGIIPLCKISVFHLNLHKKQNILYYKIYTAVFMSNSLVLKKSLKFSIWKFFNAYAPICFKVIKQYAKMNNLLILTKVFEK